VRTKRILRLSLDTKRNIQGHIFIAPLVVGFVLFFLYPFIQSVMFSLSKLELTATGFKLNYIGLENYRHALFVNADFVRTTVETVKGVLRDVPLILAFSFFAAVLLNQNFKGQAIVRMVFFLPVIMGAGVVLSLESRDFISGMMEGDPYAGMLASRIVPFMTQMRIPEDLTNYVINAIEVVPLIIRASGVQILIFLAGLQSVPRSLYEAAHVEGATPWEDFWVITFPIVSPLILTNVVYTVIDSFTAYNNGIISMIRAARVGGAGYGVSAAMSWIYFALIAVLLVTVVGIISKKVFYME
jgi:ABC-type sugar transport system permease subunit